MRIAFAMINCNRRDGSARPVNEVAERMAARGHEVHLYARRAEQIDLQAIHWHRVPGPGRPEVLDFWTYHHLVNRMLGNEKFDIVHSIGCNTLRANVVTIQNIQPSKERILRTFGKVERVNPFRRFTRKLYLQVTSKAERNLYTSVPGKKPPVFLPVSRGVASELREYYEIGDAPVQIVPNAADTKVFHPVKPEIRRSWRASRGISNEATLCIFSGGEWRRKGLDAAIRAVGLLARPDLLLYIAGEDPEQPFFEKLARQAGAGDRIFFGGFQADIATALAASDLFLFPSHYEAFSLATIEAAACGLPLVATKIHGAEDFIEPGVTGEFIGTDPEGIARVVRGLLQNPEALSQMGKNARDAVVRSYTWDRVADLTESAYETAMQIHGNAPVSA